MNTQTLPVPEDGEIDLYRLSTCGDEDGLRRLEAILSEVETKRAAGFRFDRDRARYILMHGTLRNVLSGYLGVAAGEVRFYEGERGKPYIEGGPEFNMSFSGDLGIIAVAALPVGIDIEKVNPGIATWEMVDEVFTAAEKELLFDSGTPITTEEVDSFFRGWVRKESVLKALGTGLFRPMNSIESRLDRACFKAEYADKELLTLELDLENPGYRAAVTVALKGQEPTIRTNCVWPG